MLILNLGMNLGNGRAGFTKGAWRERGWLICRLRALAYHPVLGLLLVSIVCIAQSHAEVWFDHVFDGSAENPVVLQANFGPVDQKSPKVLRNNFAARLYGTATGDQELTVGIPEPRSGVELRKIGETQPKSWPYSDTVTPKAGVWVWEGRFSVPAELRGQLIDVSVTVGGKELKARLGDVWVLAGSGNVMLPDDPSPTARVLALPPPSTAVAPVTGTGSLARDFANALSAKMNRPLALYVLSRPRRLVEEWKLVSPLDPSGPPNDSKGVLVPAVGARGLVWWHGEWQAERDPLLRLSKDGAAGAPASPSPAPLAKFQENYADQLVDATADSGLLPRIGRQLLAGLEPTEKPANKLTEPHRKFSIVVVQLQGSNRAPADLARRFPFGAGERPPDMEEAVWTKWKSYFEPESSWARVRAAQFTAVDRLRKDKWSTALVPSLPIERVRLPEHWIWSKGDAAGIGAFAERLGEAAKNAMKNAEEGNSENAPLDLPLVQLEPKDKPNSVVVVLPEGAKNLSSTGGRFELRYESDKLWHEVKAVPTPVPGTIAVPDGAKEKEVPVMKMIFEGPGKQPPTGFRYAWGDAPGLLHTYAVPIKEKPVSPPAGATPAPTPVPTPVPAPGSPAPEKPPEKTREAILPPLYKTFP
jgi:hypothetical protein